MYSTIVSVKQLIFINSSFVPNHTVVIKVNYVVHVKNNHYTAIHCLHSKHLYMYM